MSLIGAIAGLLDVEPDPLLYAGGVSAMGPGDFLNPHLDNSHNKDRARWRAFNLLYYVTPDWPEGAGGDLELWPDGIGGDRIAIHSRFNRLVVIATHGGAWHSVSPVSGGGVRLCVSNYYFTPTPLRASDRFHVTTFRGRPEQPLAYLILRADGIGRAAVRKLWPEGVIPVRHIDD